MIYFDNAATTRVDKDALKAYTDICLNVFGNPSGNYKIAALAKETLEAARERVARAINCNKDDIVFTSGGTESNNTIVQGFNRLRPGMHIVASAIEHKSVLKLLRFFKLNVTWVHPNRNGMIDPKDVEKAITPETKLITIQFTNNEVGTMQRIKEIAKIAKEHNVFFHTDAVQLVGHYPIDVEDLGVDALSASGHKFGAPKGVGFLFTKDKRIGHIYGGSQEHKQRAGTENVPGVVAMSIALENCQKNMEKNMNQLNQLVAYLETNLTKLNGVHLNVDNPTFHTIINFRIDGVNNAELVAFLDNHDVCVSLGAACNSKTNKRSFVLREIGLTDEQIDNSIRISLAPENTIDECKQFIEIIKLAIKELRK